MPKNNDRTATSTGKSVDPALDATQLSPAHTPGSSQTDDQAALTPGARIGRYEVREVLGSGGMGVVYRARDPELDRELAIKVVLPGSSSAKAQQRLLDEARAMAKLRHPNVVPVFDVGTTEHGVYIVMPLVSGGTIHDWLRAERRPWRQVLDRFVAAGRGLEAAHKAGLIHRDFKPKNVLIGDAGEVLVADFGIAARADTTSDDEDATTTPTEVSSVAGTPAYMAPEQAQRGTVDARADQFSFCISVWEGLHGERPQQAETRTQGAVTSRGIPDVPTDRRGAPGWLLATLARGFAPAPEQRWKSMSALLGEIDRRLRRPRRVALLAAGTALVGAAVALGVALPQRHEDPCPDPRGRLASAWSPSIRAKIESAFRATNLPYAADAAVRVLPVLEQYATRWRSKHIEVCRAGRVDRTQSAELYDKRMTCLDRRIAALEGRALAMTTADPAIVQDAVRLADGLPSLDDCDDSESLLAYPTPSEPGLRFQISAIERELDAVEALAARGDIKTRLATLEKVVPTTRALGFPPVHARALQLLAIAQDDSGVPPDASLRELIQTASEAGDDGRVVRGWIHLITDLTTRQGNVAEAKALEPVAEAALARAGATPVLKHRLRLAMAARAAAADQYDDAVTYAKEALQLAPSAVDKANALNFLASALGTKGDFKEALPVAEQALRETESALGEMHPEVASRLQTLGMIMARGAGDPLRAKEVLERALDIRRRSLGEAHPDVARTLLSLGNLARVRGDVAESERTLRAAVAILSGTTEKRLLATTAASLADSVKRTQGFAAARPEYERALRLMDDAVGHDHLLYVSAEANFAGGLFEENDCKAARPLFEHAASYLDKVKHSGVAIPLGMLAQCDLRDGNVEAALPTLERVISICRQRGCDAGSIESALYVLGGQLIDTGRDRRRGIALVKEARAGWEKLGNAAKVKMVDDWMKSHRIR